MSRGKPDPSGPTPQRKRITRAAEPETRKTSDTRSLSDIIQASADKVNSLYAAKNGNTDPIINEFEVQRHLLKTAIIEGQIGDPGKVAQGRCYLLLEDFYKTPEGHHWIRRNLASYLVCRFKEALARKSE